MKIPNYVSSMRMLVSQFVLLLTTVLVLDVVSYWFLPASIANKFYEYRRNRSVVATDSGYRPGYLVAHAERGHEIGHNMRSTHSIAELAYPIWSNRFGCFDVQWEAVPKGYTYFAGDSFTWGFGRFEDKFASLFERHSGWPSLKCGVSNTGTRHQFSKFKELLVEIGHVPKQVIVGYFDNDIANDRYFPSTTVIDGWMVDARSLGGQSAAGTLGA